jgi:hypothetical protein
MIEGMVQEVEYESAAAPLNWICKLDGRERKPDSAPTISIKKANGDELVAATSMTVVAVSATGGRGYLAYDAETAPFTVGATLTGGTSAATAKIERVEDSGTTGILTLSNIWGTFANNETITDSDTGSATADLAAYTCEYTYSLDASSTSNYARGEDYGMVIVYIIDTVTRNYRGYFDVVFDTFMQPIITSQKIDALHPDWKNIHPDGSNALWDEQIKEAHRVLSKRIRRLGNRPSFIVRDEELFDIELSLVRAEIARDLVQMPAEMRDFWIEAANAEWRARGEFKYDTDQDDTEVDNTKVMSPSLTR